MKIKVDLAKFKLLSKDEHRATLEHPDGHHFIVAIKALHPENRKNLDKLELKETKMADGGEVSDDQSDRKDDSSSTINVPKVETPGIKMAEGGETEEPADAEGIPEPIAINTQNPTIPAALENPNPGSQFEANNPPIEASPQDQPMPEAAEPPAQQMAAQMPQRAPQSETGAQMAGMPMGSTAGLEQQMQGVKEVQQAAAQKAKSDLVAYQADLDAKTQLQSDIQAKHQEIDGEINNWIKDQKEFKIDPNHYMSSLGTGGRIATAIGLILGGAGGGGRGNQALDFLNAQIDRDIAAQRDEMGKRNTLFSANMKRLGNEKEAMEMTKTMMQATLADNLAISASKSGSLQAQGIANQMMGPLQQQIDAQKYQMSLRKAAGQGGSIDPAVLVPQLVPPAHQKEVFGQIQAAQNTKHMGKNIMNSFEQAVKENTVAKTGAGLLRTPASVYALHQHMQPTFQDLEGTVRQAAMDNTFKNVTPMPGDTQHTIDTKRQALQEYMKSKMAAPTAKAYGIDLSKFPTTAPAADAPQYKIVRGVKYMRGPNGEAIPVK